MTGISFRFAFAAAVGSTLVAGIALAAQVPAPAASPAQAGQAAPAAGRGPALPALKSPELSADGRVTVRLRAPAATAVTLGGDGAGVFASPGAGRGGAALTKGADGVWTATSANPVPPGAYRYNFNVDGVSTLDPANLATSSSMTALTSLLVVPGDFSETRNVPHGQVSEVRYTAASLGGAARRMYVYTPPGYSRGSQRYPVLYLLHGGGDTDASWHTVGRANDIIDNLIAEGRAKPMVVVMPSGWTPTGPGGARVGQVMTSDATRDPFNDEMIKDIIPYVQANYRTQTTPNQRALAGLSMGGIQTLNVGLHNLGTFDYVVVMSSGWTTEADRNGFFEREAAKIPQYNRRLKLLWWGWGETDIARANSLLVTEKLKTLGVRLESLETPGGHTWENWRRYLYETAPKLFR